MSKVLVNDSDLSGIGSAIRQKSGGGTMYKPSEMRQAILDIPTGITPTGTVNISQNGTVNVTQYASAAVNVPNSYVASDEGKVVSNGALVAQTARASDITENGAYDTTLNDEVVVNVEGAGGASLGPDILKGIWKNLTPTVKNNQGLTITTDRDEGKITVSGTRTRAGAIDVGIDNVPAAATGALSGCLLVLETTGTMNGVAYIQGKTSPNANYVLISYHGSAIIQEIPKNMQCWIGLQLYGAVGDVVNFTATIKIYGNHQAKLIEKTITSSGTYNASDDDADGYSSVTVI